MTTTKGKDMKFKGITEIDEVVEFAADGERSKEGLVDLLGFPRVEKPARPWFNSLFYDIAVKTNQIVSTINQIINTPVEVYGVGDIYITTNMLAGTPDTSSPTIGDTVTDRLGYGVWEIYGAGQVPIGIDYDSDKPSLKVAGGTSKLNIDEGAAFSNDDRELITVSMWVRTA